MIRPQAQVPGFEKPGQPTARSPSTRSPSTKSPSIRLRVTHVISSLIRPATREVADVPRTDRRPIRICLFGLFGGGNYGNDGSLEAMLLFLRDARPDAELSCVCVDPIMIGGLHKIPTVAVSWPGFSNPLIRRLDKAAMKVPGRLMNWVRAIWHVRKFDVLLVPGTSTLCDYHSGPFGTPYGLFRWAAAAWVCRTKLCFVSTGAGPISSRLSRLMITAAANIAHYRSFRDQVSKDFVSSLGIDTSRDLVYPDLVFKLPTPELPNHRIAAGRPITIAVGVMNYNGWEARKDFVIYDAYVAKIVGFVAWLLDRGLRVRLLVGENADERVVAELGRRLREQDYQQLTTHAPPVAEAGQLIAEPIQSLHDIMRQIGDADMVIATRYHNVVCSLKLARPTISIGYEAKNEAVMTDAGLKDFCQHIDNFDVERLKAQTMEMLQRMPFYEQHVRRGLENIQHRMRQQEDFLLSSIL